MTDERGTFEHARFTTPRREHGYCTDDMARVLVVAARQPPGDPFTDELIALSLRFLADAAGSAQTGYRNRLDQFGHWEDEPTREDCWGRSIWGLGTAAARTESDGIREDSAAQLERALAGRSVWPRAMAFAALGAAELLSVQPEHRAARALLIDAAAFLVPPERFRSESPSRSWLWPEPRLTYANAVLPEAMIAAGTMLERPELLRDGLALLHWLITHETAGDHLSVTPVGGAGPDDHGPSFDQQPIEVAALADACARAAAVDDDHRWPDTVDAAAAWFMGRNDGHVVMWEPETGGGFDGLQPEGANLNQGAESTLALLATFQQAHRLVAVS